MKKILFVILFNLGVLMLVVVVLVQVVDIEKGK